MVSLAFPFTDQMTPYGVILSDLDVFDLQAMVFACKASKLGRSVLVAVRNTSTELAG